jgi:hypothetical protein
MNKPLTVYFGFRDRKMRNRVAWAMRQEAAGVRSELATIPCDSNRANGDPIYSLTAVCKDLNDARICLETALEVQDTAEEIRCD